MSDNKYYRLQKNFSNFFL